LATPPRPTRAYVDRLNRLFNLTVSESRLAPLEVRGVEHLATISRRSADGFLRLELSRGELQFNQLIAIQDEAVSVRKATYQYWLDGVWRFRYEYDRPAKEGKPHSHLHVNAVDGASGEDVSALHFPAARVSVEHIIWLLVQEYGVACRVGPGDELRTFLTDSYREWLEKRTDLADAPFP